jgi:hypothetical protein
MSFFSLFLTFSSIHRREQHICSIDSKMSRFIHLLTDQTSRKDLHFSYAFAHGFDEFVTTTTTTSTSIKTDQK